METKFRFVIKDYSKTLHFMIVTANTNILNTGFLTIIHLPMNISNFPPR